MVKKIRCPKCGEDDANFIEHVIITETVSKIHHIDRSTGDVSFEETEVDIKNPFYRCYSCECTSKHLKDFIVDVDPAEFTDLEKFEAFFERRLKEHGIRDNRAELSEPINVNTSITVTLTESGINKIKEGFGIDSYYNTIDPDTKQITLHLWELMLIFGKHMNIGKKFFEHMRFHI